MFSVKSRKLTAETPSQGQGIDLSDTLKDSISKSVLLVFLVGTSFSFAFLPSKVALGVAAGGLISLLNFRDLKKSLEKFFAILLSDDKEAGGVQMVMRYYFKLAMIVVMLAALIKNGNISIPGLIAGLSLVPVTLIITIFMLYVKSLGGRLQ